MGFFSSLLFALAVLRCTIQVSATVGDNQTRLMTNLFSGYERDVRPICDEDEPIEVKIGMAIRQIIELDEPKQILHVNVWLRLNWFDCHLQWNASEYSGIDKIILPYSKVWAPDITLYDNSGGELAGLKDYLVAISSTGDCTYNFPTVIEVLCKIDVTYFPFDTQKCPLKFGSWAYNGFEINSTNRDDAGDIGSFVANTEWHILGVPVENNIIYYGCCPEPYPDVTFYLTMKRKPLFYVLNLMFPCILISAVALLGFLLPPDAGEKVSLEITVLLSLAVFLLVVSEELPASSENFPFIGIYFAVAMMLVSLSTLLTVVVLNFHHKGNLNRPVPHWIRWLVMGHLGRLMLFRTDGRGITPAKSFSEKTRVNNTTSFENDSFNQEAYINGYTEYQPKDATKCNGSSHSHTIPIDRPLGQEFAGTSGSATIEDSATSAQVPEAECAPSLKPLLNIMKQQLQIMEKDNSRKEGKQKHDQLSSEWKKVGIILDRFFLCVFVFIMVISSLGILLPLSES